MQIRCTVQISGRTRKLILVSREHETFEHLALKLTGFLLFFDWDPAVEVSARHPAISSQEFRPDLLCTNEAGEIRLWLECGNVTTHKLNKLLRRWREARIVVLKSALHEAQNLRRALEKNDVAQAGRVEILAFPEGQFDAWLGALSEEAVDVVGEGAEKSFNLVAGGVPFSFDFLSV